MRYDGMELAPETRRALDLLKLGTSEPAPNDPAKRRERGGVEVSRRLDQAWVEALDALEAGVGDRNKLVMKLEALGAGLAEDGTES